MNGAVIACRFFHCFGRRLTFLVTDMLLFFRRALKSCKTRLIDEVLGQDSGDKVPIEKVVMLIWQFREDPQVVKFMTRFVAKVSENLD